MWMAKDLQRKFFVKSASFESSPSAAWAWYGKTISGASAMRHHAPPFPSQAHPRACKVPPTSLSPSSGESTQSNVTRHPKFGRWWAPGPSS